MTDINNGNGDGRFEEKARRAFADSVAAMDAGTRSRLTRARHAALRQFRDTGPARWARPAPVASAAVIAMLAVGIWLGRTPDEPAATDGTAVVVAMAPAEAGDLEIVLEAEDLDMLAELEFYDWLESAEGFDGDYAGDGDIG